MVSLDKTLIHRLVSFKALWSCTETLKTWRSWMTWGWVNYQPKLCQKWTTPLTIIPMARHIMQGNIQYCDIANKRNKSTTHKVY